MDSKKKTDSTPVLDIVASRSVTGSWTGALTGSGTFTFARINNIVFCKIPQIGYATSVAGTITTSAVIPADMRPASGREEWFTLQGVATTSVNNAGRVNSDGTINFYANGALASWSAGVLCGVKGQTLSWML